MPIKSLGPEPEVYARGEAMNYPKASWEDWIQRSSPRRTR